MTDTQDQLTHQLARLIQLVDDAYEITFEILTGQEPDETPSPALTSTIYDAQAALCLIAHTLKHSDKEDLSFDFGGDTLVVLEHYAQKIKPSPDPSSTLLNPDHLNPDHTTPNPDVDRAVNRAVEIGNELLAIESALTQGRTAFGNIKAILSSKTNVASEYFQTDLWTILTTRREDLRDELLRTFGVTK